MTPQQFIQKWKDNPLKERASYQLHFIDLCALVGVPHPSPASHETYCFERGATRTGAGQGWADVWKQSHFGFEYKAARRNLGEALKQLMTYALALDNPPFLGGSKMLRELGDEYTEALRKCYADRVPGGADLVTYWFEKARAQIEANKCQRAGLVATNSIRGGSNQQVLARICDTSNIFDAWSDEEWINEGAAVRVSLVCFGNVAVAMLDGKAVEAIHADLTSGNGLNLTQSQQLKENANVIVRGCEKGGSFDISGDLARQWLKQPNPNGKPNTDVVRPWANGKDITARSSDTWIIDFGANMPEQEAALYEAPFAYVLQNVRPEREKNCEERTGQKWWLHRRSGEELRAAIASLNRYIVTPRVSKYRLFVWCLKPLFPDSATFVIARSDDTIFGILHSRFHELWSLVSYRPNDLIK